MDFVFGLFIALSLLFLFGFMLYRSIGREIYYSSDHGKWYKCSNPNPSAKISNVSVDKVKYIKNGAQFKTTVEFSDGFYFITHRTNRSSAPFSLHYEISLDKETLEEILRDAVDAHHYAVQKKLSKNN